jgi:hypothetical protein
MQIYLKCGDVKSIPSQEKVRGARDHTLSHITAQRHIDLTSIYPSLFIGGKKSAIEIDSYLSGR